MTALWLLAMEAAAVALKVAVVASAATVTDAGTVSKVLLLAKFTLDPPAGAVWVSATVQVLTAPCPRLVGLQTKVETSTGAGASRLIVAVWELPPRVAVTTALWLLAMLADAVALNIAVVTPTATVTEAGTVSEALLLVTVTIDPPAGAVWVSVTVHELTAVWPRLVGLQATPDTSAGAIRLMVAVCEPLPRVAVTVAVWLLAIVPAAVALKVAVVAPAATVTDAGTVSEVLLLASVTLDPPVGAAWVSVTVQVLTAFCPRLMGLQPTPEMRTDADVNRVTVADWELVPRVAVMVALWLLAMEAAAVALNVAVVAPAATATDAGTVSEALLLASVTFEPPMGAVW
jgi:hypothetical protein